MSDTTNLPAPAANHGSAPAPVQSDNLPAPAGTPAPPAPAQEKTTFGGMISGILNFVTLSARFMALAMAAVWLKEKLHILKSHMHKDAANCRKVSEMCGQAGVDGRFQAQIIEVSQAFDRVAEASGVLANAADQMEANARMVKDAHQQEYGGVYEAVNASPYQQPMAGFNAIR